MIEQFLSMDGPTLAHTLAKGHAVDVDAVADHQYRGVSLNLPAWVDRLAWKTFRKDFHRDDQGLRGWNVRLEQTGINGPVVPKQRKGQAYTFGHYLAHATAAGHLELDYNCARNGRLDPSRCIRDPLVAVEPHDPRWLLGRSDVAMGPWRLRTPSYFLLERLGPLDFVV